MLADAGFVPPSTTSSGSSVLKQLLDIPRIMNVEQAEKCLKIGIRDGDFAGLYSIDLGQRPFQSVGDLTLGSAGCLSGTAER
jgi:hypothetical protein